MKKLLLALVSLILVAFIAFSSYWVVTNFETVKQTFNGTQIYVQTDVDAAYEDGYNTALEDASEFQALITEYRGTIADLNDVIAISTNQIDLLTTQKLALELSDEQKTAQIEALNQTIQALQETVSALNSQVSALQTQLQQTIDYYEGVLDTIDFTTRATATFLLDGVEYAVRSIELNAVGINITNPVSTSNYDFAGWTIDGIELVDPLTYQITEDVTFTAVLNYKYNVTFMLENQVYDNQIVYENNYAEVIAPSDYEKPNAPFRGGYYGYKFVGWTVDGVELVDPLTYQITEDVTFTAVLNYQVSVLFIYVKVEDGTQAGNASWIVQDVGEIIDTSFFPDNMNDPARFIGFSWTDYRQGVELVDLSSYQLTENIIVYVVINYYD